MIFFFNDPAPTEIYALSPTRRSSDLGARADPDRLPRRLERGRRRGRRGAHRRPARRGRGARRGAHRAARSEEHTSELQSRQYLVCRLLLEKKNKPSHPFYFVLFILNL